MDLKNFNKCKLIYIYIIQFFFNNKKAAVNRAAFLSNKEDFTENLNL